MDALDAMDSCNYAFRVFTQSFPVEVTFNLEILMKFIC